jgi:flagellar biosynthetic protein FlhB
MAEERNDDRTEPATPKRREEARERGHVARSQDLSSATVLLAGVTALWFLGHGLSGRIAAAAAGVFERLGEVDGAQENLLLHFGGAFTAVLLGFLPFVAVVVVAAVGINLAQVGFLFTTEAIAPNLERLDPVAGLGRILSFRSLARLAAGLLKVGVIGLVAGWTIAAERPRLAGLGDLAFESVVAVAVELMFTISFRSALALLVLAILEYGYQRWQYERDLRMSKQEVKEELKRYEGDPRIRERRRAVQRQLALQRMMQQVPKATVVITNPTHLAVAVRYEPASMEAPQVVAKGAELLAQRIRELAHEHGVPLVEKRELARALYGSVEVGQSIPAELYQAVAEILAYVMRLKQGPAAA